MKVLGSFVIAFSMYSRIPMPSVEWTKERMNYALCFFPCVGAVIGCLELALCAVCKALNFPYFGKMFPVLLPVIITGGIHMDGLLDVIDARASHGDQEKKLAILKDSHTGAFSIIGCGLYLLLYLAAFSELKTAMLPAYSLIFVLTRALSGLAVVTFPMAKKSGLAAAFSQGAKKGVTVFVMVLYLALSLGGIWYFGGNVTVTAVFFTAGAVFFYYYQMAKKEFGGITGDLAGYFLQICELALVAVLAVVSHFR